MEEGLDKEKVEVYKLVMGRSLHIHVEDLGKVELADRPTVGDEE